MKNHSSRFEKNDIVYLDFNRGDVEGPYTVDGVNFNSLSGIYMYSFKERELCVGECYLKSHPDDKKLSIGECIHMSDSALNFEEALSLKNPNMIAAEGTRNFAGNLGTIFFRPDNEFINWIVEYAKDRLIIEVGCGECFVLERLADAGAKVMGIEPFLDTDSHRIMTQNRMSKGKSMINVLPRSVEECETILNTICRTMKPLILFARPCHSDFVENGIDLLPEGVEAMYITLPENIERYDDLGKYRKKAKQLTHNGRSADKEIVFSVIK